MARITNTASQRLFTSSSANNANEPSAYHSPQGVDSLIYSPLTDLDDLADLTQQSPVHGPQPREEREVIDLVSPPWTGVVIDLTGDDSDTEDEEGPITEGFLRCVRRRLFENDSASDDDE